MIDPLKAQGRGAAAPMGPGVVYNTGVGRPDAALGLAGLYLLINKREAKLGAVCVAGAGLDAAVFCEIIGRFYAPGIGRNSNSAPPIGLPAVTPMPPDPPMVKAAVDRKNASGAPQYARTITKVTDTSQAEAVLRNGVVFNAETVVVLSAPATWLAKSLTLSGNKERYQQRVKRLVIIESSTPQQDPAALRHVIADCPSPVFFCQKEVGEALPFPAAAIEKLAAAPVANPLVDAYRAFKPMPYDAPAYDLAGMHFAVHPDSGFFVPSEPGTLAVGDDGSMKFSVGGGTVRRLTVDLARKAQALEALVALITTTAPTAAGRGGLD
jgi:hypothetical protein